MSKETAKKSHHKLCGYCKNYKVIFRQVIENNETLDSCLSCYKKTSEGIIYVQKVKANRQAAWTEEMRESVRKKYTGDGNPFFGKNHSDESMEKFKNKDFSYMKTEEFSNATKEGMNNSDLWKNYILNEDKTHKTRWINNFGEEEALRRLEDWKNKLSEKFKGEKNPMFGKPAPYHAGNGYQGWYNDFYFRSLRELSYILYMESNSLKWESGESQKFKIEYVDYKGTKRNYFPDFIVEEKYMIECKPKHLFDTPSITLKSEAAKEFCKANGYIYEIIDPELIDHASLIGLMESGLVKLTERTKVKLQTYEREQ